MLIGSWYKAITHQNQLQYTHWQTGESWENVIIFLHSLASKLIKKIIVVTDRGSCTIRLELRLLDIILFLKKQDIYMLIDLYYYHTPSFYFFERWNPDLLN
jgi:hypothetical protein